MNFKILSLTIFSIFLSQTYIFGESVMQQEVKENDAKIEKPYVTNSSSLFVINNITNNVCPWGASIDDFKKAYSDSKDYCLFAPSPFLVKRVIFAGAALALYEAVIILILLAI